MFPPGGASTLKGFAAPAFGTTTTTSGGSSDPLRGHHHFRGSQSMHGDEDGEGSTIDPGGVPPSVLLMDGPPTPHPPLRPVRHVQHATQWAESKTTVAPGLIVRSTTATVNTSQWSEYSTTMSEGVFHGRSSSSSTQFQTIRSSSSSTQSSTIAGASAPNSSAVMTSAQYLDDLHELRITCCQAYNISYLACMTNTWHSKDSFSTFSRTTLLVRLSSSLDTRQYSRVHIQGLPHLPRCTINLVPRETKCIRPREKVSSPL
jgi:hypothetical protein